MNEALVVSLTCTAGSDSSRRKKLYYIICLSLCFFSTKSFANDSLFIHQLIQRIAVQQIQTDPFFLRGIFPSYISNKPFYKEQKKDNNIFFTALILYTLKTIKPQLNEVDQLIVDSIESNSKQLFAKFKNKKGRETYNFWRTDSANNFPYTNWIHLIKKNTALPDDMDDTILSLLALGADDSVAQQVHALMQLYVNSDSNKVKSALRDYKNIPAYSTWFGKNFPVVFDVCVLSNVLSFVQNYNLEWTKADSASLQLIIKTIENKDHLTKPEYVSPYYGRTSIILYHLARLMSIKKIPELEKLKVQLITDAVNEFSSTDNLLEKAILSSAIYRLGYIPLSFKLPAFNEMSGAIEQNDLPFFIGNIPSYFPNILKQQFVTKGLGLFYHYCPAYNDVLLLEYLILKNLND